jgi:vancomycin permeability regulator SanA
MPAEPAPAGSRPWPRRLALLAALGLALLTAGDLYILHVTRDRIVADPGSAPASPYAMVLGNQVFPGGMPSRELALRLETGRQLYRAGRARRIIVSGLARPGYDEPDVMAAWLEARGVPAADVVIDRGGYRTAASMADAAAMDARSLLVVSQAYHLPRALYIAAHAGISAVGVPAPGMPGHAFHAVMMFFREGLARTEIILEIALRGVRGLPADQIPGGPTAAVGPAASRAPIAKPGTLG